MECRQESRRLSSAVGEAGNAAPYSGYKECELPVLPGEPDKLIDIGLDFLHTALHGRNGIALALQYDIMATTVAYLRYA